MDMGILLSSQKISLLRPLRLSGGINQEAYTPNAGSHLKKNSPLWLQGLRQKCKCILW